MSDDIEKLQELLAYQQHELNRMSDEIYNQQKDIGKLSEELKLMKDSMKQLSDSSDNGIRMPEEETPPPHY